jgi:hypothetical protein
MFGNLMNRSGHYSEFNKFFKELSEYDDIAFNNFDAILRGIEGDYIISLYAVDGRVLNIEWWPGDGPVCAMWDN